ncbi:MAG: SPOR domain-containing protein [Bacteroidales bacterium]|nr:SPOR domain-containing protein [Bacteroidales bacterium]
MATKNMVWKEITLFFFLILSLSFRSDAQNQGVRELKIPEDFCVSEAEWKLYRMINEYRHQYDLPPVPLSRSLSYVANTHVKDLFFHHPDIEPCNFHSWSDKGPWKAFCYPADEDKKNSVWDKPKEISDYPGKGFEIVYWENNEVVIDSVIVFWKSFDYFNGFLMNTGKWEGRQWNAIGVGICQNYAAAWFGEVADPAGIPYVCGQKPPVPNADSSVKKPSQSTPLPAKVTLQPGSKTGSGGGPYFIIVKSLLPLKEAEKIVQQLLAKGYTQSKILQNGEQIRVSIFDTADRDEALRLLREAKTLYKDAWLLKE